MTPTTLPYAELDGYRDYFNPDDAQAVKDEVCPVCGSAMGYRGFKNSHAHSMRAFAVCINPQCQHTMEF